MKKFLTSAVAAAAFLAAVAPVTHAATVTSGFTVSVSLVAICTATNSGATTVDFGTYTAFQTADNTDSVDLTFQCTRGLTAPTFSFDAVNGSATGHGVLAGLNYSLVATNEANTTTGNAATATAGGVGTADVRTVRVSGTMAGGQAGTCTGTATTCAAATASHTRKLTVTY